MSDITQFGGIMIYDFQWNFMAVLHRRENKKKCEKIHRREKKKKNRFLLRQLRVSVLIGDGLWTHSKFFAKKISAYRYFSVAQDPRPNTLMCRNYPICHTPPPPQFYLSLHHRRSLPASTSSSALHVPSNFTIMEPDLRLCSVKPLAEGVDRRFCLEVVSPSARHVLQVRRGRRMMISAPLLLVSVTMNSLYIGSFFHSKCRFFLYRVGFTFEFLY